MSVMSITRQPQQIWCSAVYTSLRSNFSMLLVTGRPWFQKRNMIYDLYPKMFVLGQRVFPQCLPGPDPSNRCDLVHWSASNCYGTQAGYL